MGDADLLARGLDRLAEHGSVAEARYGLRQARAVRDWQSSEAALATHVRRATRA